LIVPTLAEIVFSLLDFSAAPAEKILSRVGDFVNRKKNKMADTRNSVTLLCQQTIFKSAKNRSCFLFGSVF
jgi:hypothetical protein